MKTKEQTKENVYSYSIDEEGEMTIWVNNMVIATISECKNMTEDECINLMFEILSEHDYR